MIKLYIVDAVEAGVFDESMLEDLKKENLVCMFVYDRD